MAKLLNTKKRDPGPAGLDEYEFEQLIQKVYHLMKIEIDITRERRNFSSKRPLARTKR